MTNRRESEIFSPVVVIVYGVVCVVRTAPFLCLPESPMGIAEQKAEGVSLLYSDVCRLPVNPIRIANRLGLEVRKDCSGENPDVRYSSQENAIFLNTGRSLLRRRFNVCLGIGYALGLIQETEASRFAASLLMPPQDVRMCVERGYSIDRMCALFGVSSKALALRLGQLGLIGCTWLN